MVWGRQTRSLELLWNQRPKLFRFWFDAETSCFGEALPGTNGSGDVNTVMELLQP